MSALTEEQIDQLILSYHRGVEREGLDRTDAMREACRRSGVVDQLRRVELLEEQIGRLERRAAVVVAELSTPLAAAA